MATSRGPGAPMSSASVGDCKAYAHCVAALLALELAVRDQLQLMHVHAVCICRMPCTRGASFPSKPCTSAAETVLQAAETVLTVQMVQTVSVDKP